MSKVKLNNKLFYYEVYGNGDPLLLISGLGSDSSSWAGVVKKFLLNFKVIIFDNQGTGRSDDMRKPHTIHQMASDTISLLDYLKIKRSHIIGHSMGGYIAQDIAINYPERVNKLILEGTASVSSRRNNELFFEFYKNLNAKEDFGNWIRKWAYWLFSPRTFTVGRFVENFVKGAEKYPYHTSADNFKAQLEAIRLFDVRAKIGLIKAKTLILEGKDDILITPQEAGILAKNIHKSVFKLLDGAAHSIHIENPKLFTDTVLEFLNNN